MVGESTGSALDRQQHLECSGLLIDAELARVKLWHNVVDIEIECLPGNLPEYIDVDCSGLEVGDSIHLSGLKAPSGVKFVDLLNFDNMDEEERAEADQTVVMIAAPRVEAEEGEEGEAGPAEGEPKPAEGKGE